MRLTLALLATLAAAVANSLIPAAVANADSDNDPCALALSFVCKFVPIAPELDGDVDLTKQQPAGDIGLPPDSLPPNDVCTPACS